ncbi:hypothetical protein Patl1_20926 [Pistacia atlantica]|uniref:Uncharacterized protein n=1 Tax=Pistacia atlantica TaxID=434234 RepID=A0ACC1BLY3_9ROSI|nr:hypothetical protein Patl1_20926 [Pistacia atlantica]
MVLHVAPISSALLQTTAASSPTSNTENVCKYPVSFTLITPLLRQRVVSEEATCGAMERKGLCAATVAVRNLQVRRSTFRRKVLGSEAPEMGQGCFWR